MLEIFYSKKVTCLYCQEDFETYKVRVSKTKYSKRDADYCPHYDNLKENPILYEVNLCPNCGFSFTDNFSPILSSKIRNEVKEKYISQLEDKPILCEERNLNEALYAYKLALYSSILLNENKLITGNLALRIAWIYRYLKNEKEEKRFLKNVVDVYLDIYENENLNVLPMDKYLLIYLIGELYGRLGDHQNLARWFSIIIEDKSSNPKILAQTKERWLEYRELKDQAN